MVMMIDTLVLLWSWWRTISIGQRRIEAVFKELSDTFGASQRPDDLIEPDEPVKGSEDYIPIKD
jgi:hypothetical protein